MRTKEILLLMCIGMTVAFSAFAHGESDSDIQTTQGDVGRLEETRNDSNRKRMPSRNYLMVYYENGQLSLQSETIEGVFTLELINTDNSQIYSIPCIGVGEWCLIDLSEGIYDVTATDISSESIYVGELLIQ